MLYPDIAEEETNPVEPSAGAEEKDGNYKPDEKNGEENPEDSAENTVEPAAPVLPGPPPPPPPPGADPVAWNAQFGIVAETPADTGRAHI